ncbi:MAG: tol-pal system-associated acyl-CoA thioesterase [Alphaproteobacteria bacterium]|nr:tol-pal system-associated acyl-CoA thioesterase [Alphaproteobacteria bacterium]
MSLPREGRLADGVYQFPVHVYYEDTDAGGVVYYANYLRFTERARSEAIRTLGASHGRLRDEAGVILAVHKLAAEYLAPARLDDDLVVHTRVLDATGATIELKQEITRDGTRLFAMTCTVVCVAKNGRPTRLPPALAAAVAHFNPPIPPTPKVIKANAR